MQVDRRAIAKYAAVGLVAGFFSALFGVGGGIIIVPLLVMFCAFAGPPNIVRLHGRGTVHTADDENWSSLVAHFPPRPGVRAVVTIDVTRVSDSCGFAVPLYEHLGDRDLLESWASRKSADELSAYRATKNATSIDGLPAL